MNEVWWKYANKAKYNVFNNWNVEILLKRMFTIGLIAQPHIKTWLQFLADVKSADIYILIYILTLLKWVVQFKKNKQMI